MRGCVLSGERRLGIVLLGVVLLGVVPLGDSLAVELPALDRAALVRNPGPPQPNLSLPLLHLLRTGGEQPTAYRDHAFGQHPSCSPSGRADQVDRGRPQRACSDFWSARAARSRSRGAGDASPRAIRRSRQRDRHLSDHRPPTRRDGSPAAGGIPLVGLDPVNPRNWVSPRRPPRVAASEPPGIRPVPVAAVAVEHVAQDPQLSVFGPDEQMEPITPDGPMLCGHSDGTYAPSVAITLAHGVQPT